ncbi:hypothetical protein BKA81DRAFT_316847 [Phyllosticta paracitricarpa]
MGNGSTADLSNVSRGVFGATVGVDRLLKLFDKNEIKASWFARAHTIESFPEQMAKIRDAGHEIGLHDYSDEAPGQLTAQQQYDTLTKSIDILTKFVGRKPLGNTAPIWFTSKEVIPQFQELGIVYDHSFVHYDLQPYWAPHSSHEWIDVDLKKEANSWMKPMTRLRPSQVVEIPSNWNLGDNRRG